MKIRSGFVSNSSSCSFTITNISNKTKTLVDFAEETKYLVKEFREEYSYNTEDISEENFVRSAENRMDFSDYPKKVRKKYKKEYIFEPGETKDLSFGDEDGDTLGHVFDYMLRYGGATNSFEWKFKEFLR